MTPTQAGELITYLVSAFPRDALEDFSFEVFSAQIAELDDYEIGYQAVRELARSEDRFPTIKLIREAYLSVFRRRRAEHAATHSLEQAKAGPMPEWVSVWWWARHAREPVEERYFPQMVDPDNGLPFTRDPYLSTEEYEALAGEWRAAGSPKLASTKRLVDTVTTNRQD